jgi:hypothetical protein
MAVICYNGKFVTTAKSLETNVAVVTRADCIYKRTRFLIQAKFYSSGEGKISREKGFFGW